MRVYFDGASLSDETKESRRREQWRELTRLLYVTLTRPRQRLVLPWAEGFGQGQKSAGMSFAELWGDDASLARLPEAGEVPGVSSEGGEQVVTGVEGKARGNRVEEGVLGVAYADWSEAALAIAPMPTRVLPHQLAEKRADRVRGIRHESSGELVAPAVRNDGDEAIDYGLWWHETMEFMPWGGPPEALAAHVSAALAAAEPLGFAERGAKELALLQAGAAWTDLNDDKWTRQTELSVFAPLEADAWMDGVMDFVLHDPAAGMVWVLDWKTNGRRAREQGEEMLARLREEYRPQLSAYGRAVRTFFPACRVRLLVYASGLGEWTEVAAD
jgi:ATP-dependent exoDNAse (exonuclease V) beta subunit